MQNCVLAETDYNLHNVEKWEHILVGEPVGWREIKVDFNMDDDEMALSKIMDEKHLDMPISWSSRISVPHNGKFQVFQLYVWEKKSVWLP